MSSAMVRRRSVLRVAIAIIFAALCTGAAALAQQTATGVVFNDTNRNARYDTGEEPISHVAVSNGRDIVLTNNEGRYEIEVDDDDTIFVIKPRNWMTRLDNNTVPRFYYVHKPEGSPDLHYAGVEPTGDLPESVDFPLYPNAEPNRFEALFFGDPQPASEWEVDFIANDVLDPIGEAGTDAVLAFVLGDIVADRCDLLDHVGDAFGAIQIPTYFVHGNHDENYDAPGDQYADETWERVFGPATYSLNYGPVHFIVIDDVIWHPGEDTPDSYNAWKRQGHYTGGISKHDLEFIRNDLARVPGDKLVVYMFHIPLMSMKNREEFLALFEGHENVLGFSAHTHSQFSGFVDEEAGWPNDTPHLHLVAATVCGAWWRGEVDEHGIPVTPCTDNVPNGHLEVAFDGADYSIEFVPARRQHSHQMIVWAPQTVAAGTGEIPVYANIFLGNDRSTARMRIDGGEWVSMKRVPEPTEEHLKLLAAKRDEALEGVGRADQAKSVLLPTDSRHLWFANVTYDLEPGYHRIQVRTTDMFDHTYTGQRTIRVK